MDMKTVWLIVLKICREKEFGEMGEFGFCDRVMGKGVLKGVWEF